MHEHHTETPLAGGNSSSGVVRVGGTVRKPATPSSRGIQSYMRLLRDRGIDLPEPLGFDAQGRSVTEFVPGPLAMDSPALSPGQLRTVGAMVRAIHDASVGIDGDDLGLGPALIPIPAPDLGCHGDLTPWNLVLGERWVFIDWDGAAASSRVWDLAYSVQAFTLNDAGADPAEAAAHLGAFIDGYGADQALRDALLDTLPRRTWAMHDLLASAHREGREPWGSMFLEGHGDHWRGVARYVERHTQVWAKALRVAGAP